MTQPFHPVEAQTLRSLYADLYQASRFLGEALDDCRVLRWTGAATQLRDAQATVNDLLHDLSTYAGSNGVEL